MTDLVNLSFDGVHESTTFLDTSGKIWTPYYGAKLDANVKRLGTASGSFSNGLAGFTSPRGCIATPYHSDFDLGGSDFTFDFIFRAVGLNGSIWSANICGQYKDGNLASNNSYYMFVNNQAIVMNYSDGTNYRSLAALNVKLIPDVFYHIAFVRTGNTGLILVNGLLVQQTSITVNIPSSASNFVVGGIGMSSIGTPLAGMCGYIDNFRFVKSARWTDTFADVPGGPYIYDTQKISIIGE